MANLPGKIRLPTIQTPWDPVNRQDEPTFRYILDTLRELEGDKQEGSDFSLSGTASGDLLVANGSLVFVPGKVLTSSYTVSGNWTVGGALAVSGAATVTGALLAKAGVGVSGAVVLGSTLGVSGLTTIAGALNVSGAAIVVGNHSVKANLLVTGTADVTGTTTLDGRLYVFGDGEVYSKLGVNVTPLRTLHSQSFFPIRLSQSATQYMELVARNNGVYGWSVFPYGDYAETYDWNTNTAAFGTYLPDSLTALLVGHSQFNVVHFAVKCVANQTANVQEWRDHNDVVNAHVSQVFGAGFKPRDGGTNTLTTALLLGHNTSGTAAAGFGSEVRFQLESSTTEDMDAAGITVEWATATHASRAAVCKAYAYYTTTARECFRWEADSSTAKFAVLGAPAAAQQTGGAATAGALYTATEQGMLQAAYNALRTFGFLT